MDWVKKFYSQTGKWWGPAESKITERDFERAKKITRLAPDTKSILELGSGYGNTAAACARAGFDVTAVEISDRINFAKQFTDKKYSGSLKFIKADFYEVKFGNKFDVVTYWNGFGIGTDDDQKRLLTKIASEWLKPNGLILMDVQNPAKWCEWAKEPVVNKKANPAKGYNFNVSEKIEFDEAMQFMTDTWWETDNPTEKFTQKIRCYSPADFKKLLSGTGLKLDLIEPIGDELRKVNEYLVKLTK